jgi:Protein of unknown function (DUF3107)
VAAWTERYPAQLPRRLGSRSAPVQWPPVDVRIGVTYSPKELDVELPPDADAAKIRGDVEAALTSGAGSVLWLVDVKGRQIGVPVDKVTYVEIGSPTAERRIGFGQS